MSEEEKKAIEWVKNNLEQTIKLSQKYGLQEAIKYQTTILNLIEKQQEKIKRLEYDKKFYQGVIDEIKESRRDNNEC